MFRARFFVKEEGGRPTLSMTRKIAKHGARLGSVLSPGLQMSVRSTARIPVPMQFNALW